MGLGGGIHSRRAALTSAAAAAAISTPLNALAADAVKAQDVEPGGWNIVTHIQSDCFYTTSYEQFT